MEYSDNEHLTPRFGYGIDKKLFDEILKKGTRKSSSSSTQGLENEEKYKKKEKIKIKNKEGSKSKSRKKSKSKSNKKNTNESEENIKTNINNQNKDKKCISGIPFLFEEKNENPFDVFIKKRIKLRNDFDQINSEKLLSEKESAFQEFKMSENADYLDS